MLFTKLYPLLSSLDLSIDVKKNNELVRLIIKFNMKDEKGDKIFLNPLVVQASAEEIDEKLSDAIANKLLEAVPSISSQVNTLTLNLKKVLEEKTKLALVKKVKAPVKKTAAKTVNTLNFESNKEVPVKTIPGTVVDKVADKVEAPLEPQVQEVADKVEAPLEPQVQEVAEEVVEEVIEEVVEEVKPVKRTRRTKAQMAEAKKAEEVEEVEQVEEDEPIVEKTGDENEESLDMDFDDKVEKVEDEVEDEEDEDEDEDPFA
jgi:PRTRC genetic system protein E